MIKLLLFLGLASIIVAQAVATPVQELIKVTKSNPNTDGRYGNVVYDSLNYVPGFSPFDHLDRIVEYPQPQNSFTFVPIETSSGHFTYLPSHYSPISTQEQLFAQTLQELLADPEFADIRPSIQPGNIPTPFGPFGDFLEFIAKAIRRLIERRRKEQEADKE